MLFVMLQYVVTEPSAMAKISATMDAGKETVPTRRSVPAKQASSMLLVLCSLRLVFTATITNMFMRMTRGQINV